jgi:MFS transporter, DHA2 family, multidrug resistance protein
MTVENPPKYPVLLVVSVMLATIMFTVDSTIANIVLPQLQGSLQASQDQLAWVLTSYIVVSAIVTPLLSHLAARFSIAKVLLVSVLVFTLASVLCGMATSLTQMVLFRMLQGASGASLVPLSQSVLLTNFPKEKHAKMLAIWSVGVMIGPVLGPTLGGYLTDEYNWRWVFFINLPVGILAMIGVAYALPRDKPAVQKPFDVLGYILIAISIGALQLCLDRGNTEDWFDSLEIILEALVAVICFYMFAVHSMTKDNPFFTPALFQDRNFVLGSLLICVVLVGVYATMALLPLFLQQLQGYPVMQAGFLLAPRGVGLAIASVFAGKYANRLDPRLIAFSGMGLVAWSLHMMSDFNLYVDQYRVIMSGVVQGFGLGLVSVPLMTSAFATLKNELRTEATVLYALLRNIGASIGVSTSITILARSTQSNHAQLVEDLSLFEVEKWQMASSVFSGGTVEMLALEVQRQASMMAYLNDFTILYYVSLMGMPVILLMRRNSA